MSERGDRLTDIERCSCGKRRTDCEQRIADLISERDRFRALAQLAEARTVGLGQQLAGTVGAEVERLEKPTCCFDLWARVERLEQALREIQPRLANGSHSWWVAHYALHPDQRETT